MSKVLIWDISFDLANVGGPAGYLYNIHEYLKTYPNPAITFLSDLYPKDVCNKRSAPSLKEKMLANPIIGYVNEIMGIVYKYYHTTHVILPPQLNINDYDFIHFHQPQDVTRHKKLLTKYEGKLICTCHCPCLMTDEIIDIHGGIYKWLRPFLLRQELRAYREADYLMFPCREAREPYEKDSKALALFSRMEHKFFYCPSAILDMELDKSKMQKFSSFGIPNDAFVITYFGRHNEVKGYDILKALGKELLDKHENLYFLCAGRGPIPSLNHPRWIELGFINNTQELLSQSDLYVLPNRDTYFDLVVLEVLRAGVPIILSNTGGNKYFKQYVNADNGILLYDDQDANALVSLVEEMIAKKNKSKGEYRKIGDSNRSLYLQQFSMERYIHQYLESLPNER